MKKENAIKLKIEYLAFIIIAFLVSLNDRNNFFQNGDPWTDSGVFQYVAYAMGRGRAPYRDSFDIKGPVLYWIDYWLLAIPTWRNIWIAQFVVILITIVICYKLYRLYGSKRASLLSVGLLAVILFEFYRSNLAESYILPLVSMGAYIFCRYFLINSGSCAEDTAKETVSANNRMHSGWIFLCGLLMGAVILLKPNNIILWIIFALGILCKLIIDKNRNELIRTITFFAGGLLLIVALSFGWMTIKGYSKDCIDVYIIFNLAYTAQRSHKFLSTIVYYLKQTYVLPLCILAFVPAIIKKREPAVFLVFVTIVLNIILMSAPGRKYVHYIMGYLGLFPLSFTIISDIVSEKIKSRLKGGVIMAVMAVLLLWQGAVDIVDNARDCIMDRSPDMMQGQLREMVSEIQKRTAYDDMISFYGNADYVYKYAERLSASRYQDQFNISEVDPGILVNYYNDISINSPKCIGVSRFDDLMDNYLFDNGYMRTGSYRFNNNYNELWENIIINSINTDHGLNEIENAEDLWISRFKTGRRIVLLQILSDKGKTWSEKNIGNLHSDNIYVIQGTDLTDDLKEKYFSLYYGNEKDYGIYYDLDEIFIGNSDIDENVAARIIVYLPETGESIAEDVPEIFGLR